MLNPKNEQFQLFIYRSSIKIRPFGLFSFFFSKKILNLEDTFSLEVK